jgi:hypothetical protein
MLIIPDTSVATTLALVSTRDKSTLVLKWVTFRVIEGITAVMVGAEVGAEEVLTVFNLKSFTVIEVVVTSLKDLDMLCMVVRNDPICIAFWSSS